MCVVLASCAPPIVLRAPGVQITKDRLVAMPADVEIFEFDFDGKMTPIPTWTRAAAQNVDGVVARLVEGNGADSFGPEDVAGVEPPYLAFRNWSRTALLQIAQVLAGDARSNRHSVSEWRFPFELNSWRAALDFDFVLVVLFRDAHETAGRAIASSFAIGGVKRAAQTGIACVVALTDGRIVWCEHHKSRYGDLRALPGARDAVHNLLKSLLTATAESPPATSSGGK